MFLNIWFSSSSTFSLILKPKPKLLCRFAMSSTTTLTTFRNTSPPFFLSKHKNHCSSLLLLSFGTWSSGSSSILVCISSSSKLVIHYFFLIWFYCSIILCSVILNRPWSLHFGCILFSSYVHFFRPPHRLFITFTRSILDSFSWSDSSASSRVKLQLGDNTTDSGNVSPTRVWV